MFLSSEEVFVAPEGVSPYFDTMTQLNLLVPVNAMMEIALNQSLLIKLF